MIPKPRPAKGDHLKVKYVSCHTYILKYVSDVSCQVDRCHLCLTDQEGQTGRNLWDILAFLNMLRPDLMRMFWTPLVENAGQCFSKKLGRPEQL